MSEKKVEAQTLKKGDWILVNGYLGEVKNDYQQGRALWVHYPQARYGRGQTIGEYVASDYLVTLPELEADDA